MGRVLTQQEMLKMVSKHQLVKGSFLGWLKCVFTTPYCDYRNVKISVDNGETTKIIQCKRCASLWGTVKTSKV